MEEQRPLFLTPDEMRQLTGFALKAKQIEQLRRMGVAFRINGCGRPVVTRVAVEGTGRQPEQRKAWEPSRELFSEKAGGTKRNAKIPHP